MNKQQFIQLIANPSGITPEQLAELEKVVAEFPYVQVAHILIAKATADAGSMFANQKLKKAAAYTQDRKNLKRLLEGKGGKEKDITIEKDQTLDGTNLSILAVDPLLNPSAIGSEPLVPSIDKLTKSLGSSLALPPEKSDLLAELHENLALLQARKQKLGIDSPEIVIPEESTYTSLPDPISVAAAPIAKEPTPAATPKEALTQRDEPAVELPQKPLLFQKVIYTASSFHQEYPYPIRTEGQQEGIDWDTDQTLFLEYLTYLDEKRLVFRKNKKKEDDIISKIIKDEPRIQKLDIHNLPDHSIDLASKSNFANKGPISENFAKILLLQGKVDQAIEIYERLIVKNPEKKHYFATQIEKLKNNL